MREIQLMKVETQRDGARQLNSYLDFACAAGTAAFAGFTAVNHESTNWGVFFVQLRVSDMNL
jgi:hypothetical protein